MNGGCMQNAIAKHRWDGVFGTAPFRFLGAFESKFQACPGAEVKAGSSCDCCGQSIVNVFRFKGSLPSDAEFKVGVDCARKATMDDANLRRKIDRVQKEHEAEMRARRKARKINDARAPLVDLIAANQETLRQRPHPLAWRAAQGETLLAWGEWMLAHCGADRLKEVSRTLVDALQPRE